MILEKPSPPASLGVTDITKESVSLAWGKPEQDGGSRITSYQIDALEKGQDKWVKVGVTKFTHIVVYGLTQNAEYFFRVRAENHAGFSDPTEMALPVLVKGQLGELLPSPSFTVTKGRELLSITQDRWFTTFITHDR